MAEGRTAWPQSPDEWYCEAPSCTTFLLKREPGIIAGGDVWDPACGRGSVLQAVAAAPAGWTCQLFGSDIVDRRGPDWPAIAAWGRGDFLNDPSDLSPWRSIVCNPPYGKAKRAEAFVRRAVTLRGVRLVAMLLNSKFLYGAGRARGLFRDHPPTRVHPISPRPSIPPGAFVLAGGERKGGVENFNWLVWDLANPTGRTEWVWG